MFTSILVPVDLDEPSSWSKAFPLALSISKCFGARCTLATVVENSVAVRDAQWSIIGYRELLSTASARLALLLDDLCDDHTVHIKVGTGSIAGGILDLANEVEADLIVLASHRPAMKDWLIGTNASRVVRHGQCSVLVVRD